MPTHVALLRGVNVGGKKLAMADLREVVAGLGHTGVSTYIQSGNVLFTTGERDNAALAAGIERALAERLGIESGVVVLSRGELEEVSRGNPYPEEGDPRLVHVLFLAGDPTPAQAEGVAQAQRRVLEKGSRDTAQLTGRALFLHTPDGYGRSELATLIGRMSGRHGSHWTARNWATVTKLLELCST
jgi:uncharacterized protein (DUF1697 family)